MDSIAGITEKMIAYSRGNLHDIHHWLKVWGYARTIGMQEGLSPDEQFVLEVAAITHDIACPALREKYGNTNHVLQETEGARGVPCGASSYPGKRGRKGLADPAGSRLPGQCR